MATVGDQASLAQQARRLYTEELVKGLPALVNGVVAWAVASERTATAAADPGIVGRLRDAAVALKHHGVAWHQGIVAALQDALRHGAPTSRTVDFNGPTKKLSLVEHETIEREIVTSRLALAIMDRASWEFNDLRTRVALLERREELDPHDLLRTHVLARIVMQAWADAGLEDNGLRDLQPVLQQEFGVLVQEAYHEANSWLVSQRVLPDIDLRPLIRRSKGGATTGYAGLVSDETRLMTRSGAVGNGSDVYGPGGDNAMAVLSRLNKMIERQVPAFAETARAGHQRTVSPALAAAIGQAQQGVQRRIERNEAGSATATISPQLL